MDLSNENVVHIKKDGIEYLQFKRLLEYKDLINHAYSLGLDKNFRTIKANKQKLEGAELQKALNDYKLMASAIGENYINIVKPNQDHTDGVKVVNKKINKNEPDINISEYDETDGNITDSKNLILATTNADCILLLFFDPVKKVIANVHSGWKGTLQRISVKTVEKMQKEFGCNAEDIICCICPSIRKCHFEVEKDVQELFKKEFKELDLQQIIEEKSNSENDSGNNSENDSGNNSENKKWHIDTVLINKMILTNKGLKPENIIDSGICSVCNSNLVHSYRVERENYGLSTAFIELK